MKPGAPVGVGRGVGARSTVDVVVSWKLEMELSLR